MPHLGIQKRPPTLLLPLPSLLAQHAALAALLLSGVVNSLRREGKPGPGTLCWVLVPLVVVNNFVRQRTARSKQQDSTPVTGPHLY